MNFTSEHLSGLYFEKFHTKTASKDAMLFLHGYPANIGYKNRDLADFSSNQFSMDTFLIHYSGLGNSTGNYSFSNSVNDVESIIKYLKKMGYSKIHFIGHSWGGFLTLKLSQLWDNESKIVLLSPFINFPYGQELTSLASHIYKESSIFLSPMTEEETIEDLNKVRLSTEQIISNIKKLNNKITLIQAQNDDETPREHAEEFARALINQIDYHEINSDHSFSTNRELLKKLILSGLR
jgi:esterase/lipase